MNNFLYSQPLLTIKLSYTILISDFYGHIINIENSAYDISINKELNNIIQKIISDLNKYIQITIMK